MSEHDRTRKNLPALLAGVLSPEEAARTRAHLAACPECAREEKAWQQLLRAMQRIPETLPTPARLARIKALAQARREEVLEKRWNRFVLLGLAAFGWVFGFANIVVGGLLVASFLNGAAQEALWSSVYVAYLGLSTLTMFGALPLLWKRRQALWGKL